MRIIRCRHGQLPREAPVVLHFFPHRGLGDRVVFQALIAYETHLNREKRHIVLISFDTNLYGPLDYSLQLDEVWVSPIAKPWIYLNQPRVARLLKRLLIDVRPEATLFEIKVYDEKLKSLATAGNGKVSVEIVDLYQTLGDLASRYGFYPSFAVRPDLYQATKDLMTKKGIDFARPRIALHCRQRPEPSRKNLAAANIRDMIDLIRRQIPAQFIAVGADDIPTEIERSCDFRTPRDPSLQSSACAMQLSDVFIGSDSGPTHLAAATGTMIVFIQDKDRPIKGHGPFTTSERIHLIKGVVNSSSDYPVLAFDPDVLARKVAGLLLPEAERCVTF